MIEKIGAFADHRFIIARKCRDHGFGRFLAELLRAFLDARVEELARIGLIAAGARALGDDGRKIIEIEAGHRAALRWHFLPAHDLTRKPVPTFRDHASGSYHVSSRIGRPTFAMYCLASPMVNSPK